MGDSFLRFLVSLLVVAAFFGFLYAGTILLGRFFIVGVLASLLVGRFAFAIGLNSGIALAMKHQRPR